MIKKILLAIVIGFVLVMFLIMMFSPKAQQSFKEGRESGVSSQTNE